MNAPAAHEPEVIDRALEKAAKFICNLKWGVCPMRERDFSGCPFHCHEEIRPWMCWKEHFRRIAKPGG